MSFADFVKHFFERFFLGPLAHVQISRQLLDLVLVKEGHIAIEDFVGFSVIVQLSTVKVDEEMSQIVIRRRFTFVNLYQML